MKIARSLSQPRAGRRDTHDTPSWSSEKSLKRRLFTLSKSRNGGNGASTAFATQGAIMRARSTLTLVAVFLVGGVAATMLATPAMARESHVSWPHLSKTADASTASEGDRFRGYESHDVWGHWGTYYGPTVSVP